ncbi:MAG TPA: two-component regulator propeller domain-containing protein [Verrucomicrobiae bacterium]|nr:two-component regulator propeller domain-containing protein [Verrucomicrobiae bacterium]
MNFLSIHLPNWIATNCRVFFFTILLVSGLALRAEPIAGPGQLAVARAIDGRLHLFKVDRIGNLRQRWQRGAGGDWTPWADLGGSFLPGITVTTNVDGWLEVFAVNRSDGSVGWLRERRPNRRWSRWADLGGRVQAPVAVGHNSSGGLDLFALDAAGNVMHTWQTNADGPWSGWENLGGALEPGIVVIRNAGGCLELFGVKANAQTLAYCQQTVPSDNGRWKDWQNLGGAILPGIAVGQETNGMLEVFGVNSTNSAVDYLYNYIEDGTIKWSSWTNFGRSKVMDGLTISQNQDGRLELFAVERDNQEVIHRWQVNPASKTWFSHWDSLGGKAMPYPTCGINEDGSLEIFGLQADDGLTINHIRQIKANSDWLDWFDIEHLASPYSTSTRQTDEGLPHNIVRAIAQTPDGYLWAGTVGGLARFDGVTFKVFDSKNTEALRDSHITALCVDSSGALWIGTYDGLTRRMDGDFTRYDRAAGLAGEYINVICERRDGSIWIGTESGLSRYKHGIFKNYTTRNGLLSDAVRAIYEDRSGTLWVGTTAGLNYLNPGDGADTFGKIDELQNVSIRGMTQDRSGRLWIGSDNGMIWHHYGPEFYAYGRQYGLSDPFVNVVCEDNQGNLWVGTQSGLNRFRDGRFFNELDNEGDPYDEVNAIFQDRDGDLWIGSNEGLTQLTQKRFFPYDMRQGLSHNDTVSVLQDRNGNTWVGTFGGGLNVIRDESVEVYCRTNGLANDEALSLCESRDGSVWVGEDNDGGLYRFEDGKVDHYTWQDGLIRSGILAVYEDRASNLWTGASQGISCLRNGRFASYQTNQYYGGKIVRAICEDHDGNILFGTDRGLCRFSNGCFTNITDGQGLSDISITALFEDEKSNLWIGTESDGLVRFNMGFFKIFTSQEGLFSDSIYAIIEDQYGWLWMSSPKGIFRVRTEELDALSQGNASLITSINYGKADGLETTICSGNGSPGVWKAQDGRLWFATTKGLVAVNPDIKFDRRPSPVFIEQFSVDGKRNIEMPPGRPDAGERLIIPPGHGTLEFQFTMLDYRKPAEDRFFCRLEGVDQDWVDVGARRSAYYNNLRPGHYVFRLKGRNANGVWNEPGASMEIVLRPHYWQTWWFRALTAMAAAAAVAGISRYMTSRRMQRELQRLGRQNAVEKERSRIAKDIHDDLGSRLTRMMLLGQRVQEDAGSPEKLIAHARKMVDSAVNTMQIMDEIVWAVDPQKDTLNGLVGYIGQYANEFLEGTRIRCRLEMPVDVPAMVVPAEARHEVFLALKEALNNAARHAQATEVRIAASVSGGRVTIVVEDNGCGFRNGHSDPKAKGNGLENMAKRMEKLGGKCAIKTRPGAGTQITLTLRVNERTL